LVFYKEYDSFLIDKILNKNCDNQNDNNLMGDIENENNFFEETNLNFENEKKTIENENYENCEKKFYEKEKEINQNEKIEELLNKEEEESISESFNYENKICGISLIFFCMLLNILRIQLKLNFKQIDGILKFFYYFIPGIPKNLYYFKKILNFEKKRKKFFCLKCKIENENNVCSCGEKSENFIIYDNLQNILLKLFTNNFIEKNNLNNNNNNIDLILCTDGVPLNKTNSSLYSIWPFYLTINNLKYHKRFKKENILMPLILYKKKGIKINFNIVTQGLFHEIKKLKEGLLINGKKFFFNLKQISNFFLI